MKGLSRLGWLGVLLSFGMGVESVSPVMANPAPVQQMQITEVKRRSQLMSLWTVDDSGTKDMMVSYYRQLKLGEERAEAL